MNNFSFVINEMRWSYSRLKSYHICPYGWKLQYIEENEGENNFFAEYGLFIHHLLEKYFKGEIEIFDLSGKYELEYFEHMHFSAPYNKYADIGANYFDSGKEYFDNFDGLPQYKILEVEEKHKFKINDYEFVGYLDLVVENEDGEIEIVDNKSAGLKPRSKGKKVTKTDLKLNDFLRQLYIYSIPIYEKYGKYPKYLNFNCFRKDMWIQEEFKIEDFEEAKTWAINTIESLTKEREFKPKSDWFYCHNLCNFRNIYCEFKGV